MKRTGQGIFRFYAELNDFFPAEESGKERVYRFRDKPSIKDAIEAQGVPHTEVELILVDGRSVGFEHGLADGERVSVYPMFESVDILPLLRVRDRPLREARFVCDVHLGKLARRLRLHGFDTLYRNDYDDPELAEISAGENRVILTRDRRLLHRKAITHGYWIRSHQPDEQLGEVLRRFQLENEIRPFRRCPVCNGRIHAVSKEAVLNQLEPKTKLYYDTFFHCEECGKVYWQGSHYDRMLQRFPGTLAGPDANELG